MTSVVSGTAKEEPDPARKRLPRSVRKHIRRAKAALRREHAPADAEKAIEQLVMKLRR